MAPFHCSHRQHAGNAVVGNATTPALDLPTSTKQLQGMLSSFQLSVGAHSHVRLQHRPKQPSLRAIRKRACNAPADAIATTRWHGFPACATRRGTPKRHWTSAGSSARHVGVDRAHQWQQPRLLATKACFPGPLSNQSRSAFVSRPFIFGKTMVWKIQRGRAVQVGQAGLKASFVRSPCVACAGRREGERVEFASASSVSVSSPPFFPRFSAVA